MNLKLEKPLAFLDLETTGVNVSKDKIVEIAIIKINPDSSKEEYNKRINPEIPIPIETSEIHGIYDFDVINSPNFKAVSSEIEDFIKGCDLGGFNSNKFDIPLLVEEFYRCNIDIKIEERKLIDVQNIFHKMEQRTLVAAYQFYCNKDLTNAHSALADTAATLAVFMAQLEKYESLENNIDFLHDFSIQGLKTLDFAKRIAIDKDNNYLINFGKHKGKKVIDVFKSEPSYYSWIQSGDFTTNTKLCFKKIWNEFKTQKV
ncbi:MAG: 3'-5' exonuclease [Flavobacteriales bacterium]|nr:3'-5' exonuclease [Flavobacteriales bacterium]